MWDLEHTSACLGLWVFMGCRSTCVCMHICAHVPLHRCVQCKHVCVCVSDMHVQMILALLGKLPELAACFPLILTYQQAP